MKYGIDPPRNLVTNREDVSLRMEMLPLADFSEVDNRHDANVQGQQRFTLLVTRYDGDTVALGEDCMRLQPLGLCESLVLWCTRWSYSPRSGIVVVHHWGNFT